MRLHAAVGCMRLIEAIAVICVVCMPRRYQGDGLVVVRPRHTSVQVVAPMWV
jgi:hypothetical protein